MKKSIALLLVAVLSAESGAATVSPIMKTHGAGFKSLISSFVSQTGPNYYSPRDSRLLGPRHELLSPQTKRILSAPALPNDEAILDISQALLEVKDYPEEAFRSLINDSKRLGEAVEILDLGVILARRNLRGQLEEAVGGIKSGKAASVADVSQLMFLRRRYEALSIKNDQEDASLFGEIDRALAELESSIGDKEKRQVLIGLRYAPHRFFTAIGMSPANDFDGGGSAIIDSEGTLTAVPAGALPQTEVTSEFGGNFENGGMRPEDYLVRLGEQEGLRARRGYLEANLATGRDLRSMRAEQLTAEQALLALRVEVSNELAAQAARITGAPSPIDGDALHSIVVGELEAVNAAVGQEGSGGDGGVAPGAGGSDVSLTAESPAAKLDATPPPSGGVEESPQNGSPGMLRLLDAAIGVAAQHLGSLADSLEMVEQAATTAWENFLSQQMSREDEWNGSEEAPKKAIAAEAEAEYDPRIAHDAIMVYHGGARIGSIPYPTGRVAGVRTHYESDSGVVTIEYKEKVGEEGLDGVLRRRTYYLDGGYIRYGEERNLGWTRVSNRERLLLADETGRAADLIDHWLDRAKDEVFTWKGSDGTRAVIYVDSLNTVFFMPEMESSGVLLNWEVDRNIGGVFAFSPENNSLAFVTEPGKLQTLYEGEAGWGGEKGVMDMDLDITGLKFTDGGSVLEVSHENSEIANPLRLEYEAGRITGRQVRASLQRPNETGTGPLETENGQRPWFQAVSWVIAHGVFLAPLSFMIFEFFSGSHKLAAASGAHPLMYPIAIGYFGFLLWASYLWSSKRAPGKISELEEENS